MSFLWKIVRPTLAVIGAFLIFGSAGTSDYYTLELKQPEPNSVWITLAIGLLMMAPMVIHAIPSRRENDDVDNK